MGSTIHILIRSCLFAPVIGIEFLRILRKNIDESLHFAITYSPFGGNDHLFITLVNQILGMWGLHSFGTTRIGKNPWEFNMKMANSLTPLHHVH